MEGGREGNDRYCIRQTASDTKAVDRKRTSENFFADISKDDVCMTMDVVGLCPCGAMIWRRNQCDYDVR